MRRLTLKDLLILGALLLFFALTLLFEVPSAEGQEVALETWPAYQEICKVRKPPPLCATFTPHLEARSAGGEGVGLVPGEHRLLSGPTSFYVMAAAGTGRAAGQTARSVRVDFSAPDWNARLLEACHAIGSGCMTPSTDEKLRDYYRAMRAAWNRCPKVLPADPSRWSGEPDGLEPYLAGGLSPDLPSNPYEICRRSLEPPPEPEPEEPEPDPVPGPTPEPEDPPAEDPPAEETLCERCARRGIYGHPSCAACPCPEGMTPDEPPYCDAGEPTPPAPDPVATCTVSRDPSTGRLVITVEERP